MSTNFGKIDYAHNRYNLLLDQWVLACPNRLNRPWQGQIESDEEDSTSEFDSKNPLCPGAIRSSGQKNPVYESTFAFDNDFSALRPESCRNTCKDEEKFNPFFQTIPAYGHCRVMCFHPNSNISLPLMEQSEILKVIQSWIAEFRELASQYKWVQIFENKGAIMGCSNPHPHCQIWASDFLPNDPKIEDKTQREYFEKNQKPLLFDYLGEELKARERIVFENDSWVVLIPFWAYWPFETILLPRRRGVHRITDLSMDEQSHLAEIMKALLIRYDNLFRCSFPYSMGWHGAPTGSDYCDGIADSTSEHWTLHAHFFPPLVRSSKIKKFMAGYELLAQPQRDLNPETAATKLKEQQSVHYKKLL